MDQIIVEGVRCFRNLQTVPLRPITLLVGENSSGKSTFLALTRLASQLCRGKEIVDFNEEPFLLGAYDQIASQSGKSSYLTGFTIGAQIAASSVKPTLLLQNDDFITITGRFTKQEAQPKLTKLSLRAGKFFTEVKREYPNTSEVLLSTQTSVDQKQWEMKRICADESSGIDLELLDFFSIESIEGRHTKRRSNRKIANLEATTRELQLVRSLFRSLRNYKPPTPYAFAPVRSHPKRTYDPIKDVRSPEGTHVPMILARMSSSELNNWKHLRQIIASFGKASGLFSDLEVRRIGRQESDPFQIRIKVASSAFNLMDVGYGVSQILPILVDVIRGNKGGTYLLQQPEVHLHPKAQAELGSFLGTLAKAEQKRFVIETHSDYLVDRVRMEVRNQRLSPNDVALLYFERLNGHVEIRHLELDQAGNIINAPASYRQFFLTEEMRLLGFGE